MYQWVQSSKTQSELELENSVILNRANYPISLFAEFDTLAYSRIIKREKLGFSPLTKRTALRTLLTAWLAVSLLLFLFLQTTRFFGNFLILRNRSKTTITSVEVRVNDWIRTTGPLKPGESITLALGYHQHESSAEICAQFEDGSAISFGVGYLDSGIFGEVFDVDIPRSQDITLIESLFMEMYCTDLGASAHVQENPMNSVDPGD